MTTRSRFDFVVIGAGSSGTSIAFNLARRRAGRVLLIDQSGIASGATGRSSAIVRQHYANESLARMALYSLRVFEEFAEVVGGTAEFHRTGYMAVYGHEDLEALQANIKMQQRVGIDTRFVSPAELLHLESRLSVDDIAGGAWEPRAGYADPVSTASSFARAGAQMGLERRLGQRVQRVVIANSAVRGVVTADDSIEADTVIVAAGFRTAELLQNTFEIPLTPVRHPIAIVERTPDFGNPHPVVADRIQGAYFRPEGGALSLAGASAGFDGDVDANVEEDKPPMADETTSLAQKFARRFPGQAGLRLRRGYTGIYDCSPDLHPLLGAAPGIDRLFVVCGLSGHGFKLAPAIGQFITDLALTGQSELAPSSAFDPSRFARQEMIAPKRPYVAKAIP